MSETRKIRKSKQPLKKGLKTGLIQPARGRGGLAQAAELPEELMRVAGSGDFTGQMVGLNHPNLQVAQRHALAAQLGQLQGNRGLQNALVFPGAGFKMAQRQAPAEEGNPSAPVLPGTTIHPTVSQGSTGPAVEELQEKLNADGATPPLVVDGIFGPLTRKAAVAFQTKYGLDPDGIVGPITWGQIDTLGLASSVGRVEKEWEENVGGQTYGMTSRYTWRIVNNEIRVTVKLKFTGLKNPALVERWFSYIRSIWNRFTAVNDATGEEIAIVFDPQSVSSEPDNVVEIKPGDGRSDAANWFADDPDSDNTAAHEFGHMIGLEDEYQRTHTDYKRLVGEEPDEGETTNPVAPEVIAAELNTALMKDDEADRVSEANDVVTNHGLVQGEFAQEVATAYQTAFGLNLVDHIVSRIPDEDEWDIVDPFTHSSGSMMGVNTNHEHPVEPRHVREFVGHIAAFKGGEWKAEER